MSSFGIESNNCYTAVYLQQISIVSFISLDRKATLRMLSGWDIMQHPAAAWMYVCVSVRTGLCISDSEVNMYIYTHG